MPRHRRGGMARGGDIVASIEEHDAEKCLALIACDVQHVATGKNVVLLVMGRGEGEPVAFIPMDCIHAVEMTIDRLRRAAECAFKNQPCTECEKVE